MAPGAGSRRPSQGGGGRKSGVSRAACPHLHRVVAQLNGLVDALHDLVETCGEGEKEGSRRVPPPLPPHTHRGAPELGGAWETTGSRTR